jgi:putative acetyltransferase
LIRPERASDIVAIHLLTKDAFRIAEHTSFTEQFITDALRDSGKLTLSLVAVDKDQIVGHIAISPVTLSDGTQDWYGLGPIAVLPTRQREGIGSQLISHALDMLRAKGARGCVVLGEPQYYGRFGFRATAPLVLPDVPAEYFQALSFVDLMPSAQVQYDKSFDATGPL